MRKILALLAFALAPVCFAQGTASHIRTQASAPSNCIVGDVTTTTSGTVLLKWCNATNTWVSLLYGSAAPTANQAINGTSTGSGTGFTGTAGTITSGHLACYTSSNTIGNCPGLAGVIGVFNSGTTWISSGEATVTLDATVNVTVGDHLCASPTSFGTAHNNGANDCTQGLSVGIVKTTASSVSSATAFLALR